MFSVTSEESFTLSTPGILVAQLSKSPSAEFITEATEEHKAQMFMQESVFAHLSIEEKECILNVPAAKHLDDLQMFVRYGECSKISNTFLFLFSTKMYVIWDGIHKNACQNSKQGRPRSDCFLRRSVIWVCTVCLGPFEECILNVPAAKHLDDLQMFVRYGECSKISNTFLFLFSTKMYVIWAGIHKNACQNSKQGRPRSDCFLRCSVIWVCTVCLGPFEECILNVPAAKHLDDLQMFVQGRRRRSGRTASAGPLFWPSMLSAVSLFLVSAHFTFSICQNLLMQLSIIALVARVINRRN